MDCWTGRAITTNWIRIVAVGDSPRHPDNPLAALLPGIPDINSEELEDLLSDLPTPDAAIQAPSMTRAESMQVNNIEV